jgi:hypothetical protein
MEAVVACFVGLTDPSVDGLSDAPARLASTEVFLDALAYRWLIAYPRLGMSAWHGVERTRGVSPARKSAARCDDNAAHE